MNPRSSRKGKRSGGLLAAILLCWPVPALAWQAGGPGGNPEAMREELQETIEIYMIAKMKRALALTDEQERRIVPLVEDLNASRREFNRKRRLTLMKLRPLVEEAEDQAADEREIGRLVQQLDEMDRQFHEKEMRSRDEVRAALTPLQQARFIFFMDRFRQEMEQRLRRLQQEQGPRPGMPPGNQPFGKPRRRP